MTSTYLPPPYTLAPGPEHPWPKQSSSSHPSTPQPFSSGEGTHDAELFTQAFLPASEIPGLLQKPPGIPRPICIPQIAPSFDAPFARGYNAVLRSSVGISQDELLAFIDGLNLAMTSSPPLRVVDMAGDSHFSSGVATKANLVAGLVIGFMCAAFFRSSNAHC